ncbi:D-ribose pyranase [Natronosporangium hydrolyticum]|uniref:D-ribose pyranase n=1 Tax=Natronosporangium hydrolyticum TaxID=2811111 RepID=A0A895YG23_9ACTN|nr:D-ribose pyranase [Natronosporangium hydrolyticum]QSB16767.1 D-ribose pyranase [Natronosporangium hydrolyticum]
MLCDHPLLHPQLLRALAAAGHTDLVVIADAGLPLPSGVEVIDLSLVPGVPSFAEVLRAVLASLVVEELVVAEETTGEPADTVLAEHCAGLPRQTVPHAELKRLCHSAHLIIRTGECTRYANAALVAGVAF